MSTQRIEQTVQEYTYQRPKRTRDDVDFPLGPEQSKSRQEDDSGGRDSVRGRILSLLRQVDGEEDGRLTFADVLAHHEDAQSEWNEAVAEDLADLGVDVDSPFRLMYDPAGAVTVAGDHPDREMIDNYFRANPDRVAELGDILQYGKLASAARANLGRAELDRPLSAEAMSAWYANNMSASALASGGGLLFGSGGAVYRGLDIRV